MTYRTITHCLVLLIVVLSPAISFAELYLGIGPYDSLGDLKKKFPNASFFREYPAWAQEEDVMYIVSGKGISGKIIIVFHDERPEWRRMLQEEQDEERKAIVKPLAEASDDTVTVFWLRWMPDVPFPLARLITKYGKPEVSGLREDNFEPYKQWSKRGVLASLSDDGKNVLSIDFRFTPKDREEAWKRKYNTPYPFKKK